MITKYLVEIYPDCTVETVSVKYALLMESFYLHDLQYTTLV